MEPVSGIGTAPLAGEPEPCCSFFLQMALNFIPQLGLISLERTCYHEVCWCGRPSKFALDLRLPTLLLMWITDTIATV